MGPELTPQVVVRPCLLLSPEYPEAPTRQFHVLKGWVTFTLFAGAILAAAQRQELFLRVGWPL
jgi:hypothetical protein